MRQLIAVGLLAIGFGSLFINTSESSYSKRDISLSYLQGVMICQPLIGASYTNTGRVMLHEALRSEGIPVEMLKSESAALEARLAGQIARNIHTVMAEGGMQEQEARQYCLDEANRLGQLFGVRG